MYIDNDVESCWIKLIVVGYSLNRDKLKVDSFIFIYQVYFNYILKKFVQFEF